MKWYGLRAPVKPVTFSRKKKIFLHKKPKINMNGARTYFHIPPFWSFFLISKKNVNFIQNIFVFSDNYYFSVPVYAEIVDTRFHASSRTLKFFFFSYNSFYRKFWKLIYKFFLMFSKVFFKKLKFKGKGYYIYKNIRNTIALKMGYSHLIRLYAFIVHMKFTAKTTIFMFGVNEENSRNRGNALRRLKPINIFTGRGIRFSRQIVYRKPGKMSTYR